MFNKLKNLKHYQLWLIIAGGLIVLGGISFFIYRSVASADSITNIVYSTQGVTTTSKKDISPIAKNQMSRYPDFGTINGRVDKDDGSLYWVIGGDRATIINETYNFNGSTIINNKNNVAGIGCVGNPGFIFTFLEQKTKTYTACKQN